MALDVTHRPPGSRDFSGEAPRAHPRVAGKFLSAGDTKLWVRGVTYGPFRPGADGVEYPPAEVVGSDFDRMVAHGINAVRTYTAPPRWFLDAAWRRGLRVMVGLAWEQHVAFLDDPIRARSIVERVRAEVRACAGHPAVLCYAVGNEIPAPIVRWHGAPPVERFIERLYRTAKAEDPTALVTYVNYPTTEYLQLPFLDVVCFNIFLESRERFEAYLARLQTIAGNRPLILTETGLDSLRHGDHAPEAIASQIRGAFAAGCAGVCVFAWTDEWFRGGYEIDEWAFGLTDRDRGSKPALAAVQRAFAEVPFPPEPRWPRASVVVCTRNGARTIRDCLEGLRRLEYPDYEVIVVNDGSWDDTATIVRGYGFRVIDTDSQGLSAARNTGLAAATGEIVAYIDDDAVPDRHWLSYLAATFLSTDHAAVGGPNIPPAGDGMMAECIANAPGGPIHVLVTDQQAEHIPGCNAAFRKASLEAIGGFDPQFRAAGDDVDVCWRLEERGWTVGFAPGAMVWHRRRSTIAGYWAQQKGYGRAEALLERKWPQKYNAIGHLSWRGRLYAGWLTHTLGWTGGRIYQGTWGTAPFQSLEPEEPSVFWALPTLPEWYLVILALAALSALGAFWTPLLHLALAALAFAVAFPVLQSGASAAHTSLAGPGALRARCFFLTMFLHLCQPAARLAGRLELGLTPWRRHGAEGEALPWPHTLMVWNTRWRAPTDWLEILEADLRDQGAVVLRGGDYDPWDLEVRAGTTGSVRVRMAVEEHGAGQQLARIRAWPHVSPMGVIGAALLAVLGMAAVGDQAWLVGTVLGLVSAAIGLRIYQDCAASAGTLLQAVSVGIGSHLAATVRGDRPPSRRAEPI